MGENKKMKLSYEDISIVPEIVSEISSRSECNIHDENGKLPIFTAPMDTVINAKNIGSFLKNKINVVIPRTIDIQERLKLGYIYNSFIAISLTEAKDIFLKKNEIYDYLNDMIYKKSPYKYTLKICIDIANGHMRKVLNLISDLKSMYDDGSLLIMAGNIANPKTYKEYEKVGCDYVRVGIGGGSVCSTSSNTGIHFPYFSLIEEVYKIKKEINGKCKIIADGNIRGYRDIQKALLFADYVMIGSLFNKTIESAGKTTYGKCYWVLRGYKIFRPLKTLLCYGREVNPFNKKLVDNWKKGKFILWKQYYGMSTKIAQKAINPKAVKLKTAEGIVKYQKVESTLDGWVENECDYLKSAMSYTNSHDLNEYKDSEYITMLTMRFNN